MGFRCPLCKKDFGIDKAAFIEHTKRCANGLAQDFVNLYLSKNEEDTVKFLNEIAKKMQKP